MQRGWRIVTALAAAVLCSAPTTHADTSLPTKDPNFTAEPSGVDIGPTFDKAWRDWRKRVADKIDERYKLVLPALKREPIAYTEVMYCVTNDGHVKIKILRGGANMQHNRIIVAIIQWLEEDKRLLRFPAGSRRKRVCIRAKYDAPEPWHHSDIISGHK